MAVTMKLRADDLQKLGSMLSHIKGGLEKAIARASRRVAKQGVTFISSEIRGKVNIKKKDLDRKVLTTKQRGKTGQVITLEATSRFPLKYFGAKQTKKGVTYQIPSGKGQKKLAVGAFGPNIPRLGGQVFRRAGKNRLPIVPLFGVSPWGTFMINKMLEPTRPYLARKFAGRVMAEAKNLIEQHANKKGKK